MLSDDIPVGSVSGRRGWESTGGRSEPPDDAHGRERAVEPPCGGRERTRPSGAREVDPGRGSSTGDRREQVRELRREVAALEAELERKERCLQYAIDHYERLYSDLLERCRAGEEGYPEDRRTGLASRGIRSRLRALLPSRR